MAKRSDFERIERDLYRSFDPKIGTAIAPFLDNVSGYVEPFAGAGDLINQINAPCTYASDLVPLADGIIQKDAFTWSSTDVPSNTDTMITNSPWDRKIFHKALDHFNPLFRQCWWVIDYNWCATKRASYYLDKYATHIVVIGRCKWIPGTTMSGKDDVIWLRTSKNKSGGINFYPRSI